MQTQAAGQPPLARLPGSKPRPAGGSEGNAGADGAQNQAAGRDGRMCAERSEEGEAEPEKEKASAQDIIRNLVKEKYMSDDDEERRKKETPKHGLLKRHQSISFNRRIYDFDSVLLNSRQATLKDLETNSNDVVQQDWTAPLLAEEASPQSASPRMSRRGNLDATAVEQDGGK
jgi:hypothetical protein